MNDTVDLWVSRKDLIEGWFIGDVDLVEVWSLSAKEFDSVEDDLGRVVQTIYDDDFVAMFQQCQGCEGTNVTSTTKRTCC